MPVSSNFSSRLLSLVMHILPSLYVSEQIWLVVRVSSQGLCLLGLSDSIMLDEDRYDCTSGFSIKGRKSDIQKQ